MVDLDSLIAYSKQSKAERDILDDLLKIINDPYASAEDVEHANDVIAIQLHLDKKDEAFIKDLAIVINVHNRENVSNTPDFILAQYLYNCLRAFEQTVTKSNQ